MFSSSLVHPLKSSVLIDFTSSLTAVSKSLIYPSHILAIWYSTSSSLLKENLIFVHSILLLFNSLTTSSTLSLSYTPDKTLNLSSSSYMNALYFPLMEFNIWLALLSLEKYPHWTV